MNISKPTLLVDEHKARKNIGRMVDKARKSGAVLRPHFKTHQSATIAEWFRDAGVACATVSSVDMAKYFAAAGWEDITIAFPYNPLEAKEIEKLANQIKLNLTIVSPEALAHMNENVNAPVGYFIKIDVGTHRTGMHPEKIELIREASQSMNKMHQLQGLMAHAGHSYHRLTKEDAQEIFNDSMSILNSIKRELNLPNLILSYGDTPTCSLLDKFPGVDEIRAGNFVFYDAIQTHFGSCDFDQVAVCMACPVVAIHPERSEAVVYGGGVHLSKDFIPTKTEKNFGTVVALTEKGWDAAPIAMVDRLSQEHGILKGDADFIGSLQIGDLVGILPVHSCLAADLQPYYVSLDGQKIDKFNKHSL